MKKPILIKDLGTDKNRSYARFGIFECQYCFNNYKTEIRLVDNGRSTKCKPCASSITKNAIKHGNNGTKLHSTWLNINRRCYDENSTRYKDWGGRGIKVCDEWKNDYLSFKKWALENGYKIGLTLDREENNGDYEPSNCRWTTMLVQARNKRKSILNTSGYIGVYNAKNNKFHTEITVNYKTIFLGLFDTKIEAAKARDNYIIENKLEHTKNFS